MNYFRAYVPSWDEAIVAAWDSQVAAVAEEPSLAQILATKNGELFPRFADSYGQLRALPRATRRALQRHLARSGEFAIPSKWRRKLAGSLAGAALLLALAQGPAQADDIFVDTTNPAIDANDDKCSLIEAIINANDDMATHDDCPAGSGADRILLPENKTISLNSSYVTAYISYTGLPVITSPITIEGKGKIVRKKSAPDFRLMAVGSAGSLTLNNVTLSRGRTGANGGGIYNNGILTLEGSTVSGNSAAGVGGGIYNSGVNRSVTITNSTISNNYGYYGGGIYNADQGAVTIANSTVSGNKTAYYGGGLISVGDSTVTITNGKFLRNYSAEEGGAISIGRYSTATITNSAISGNRAKNEGGGIFLYGTSTLTVDNSTISRNTAVTGGGIGVHRVDAVFTITNSTLSGNKATYGGGVYSYYATGTIENSLISGNKAYYGGGIFNEAPGTLTVTNSTISGNTADGGGGLYNAYASRNSTPYFATLTVNNGTIASNKARFGGGINNDGILVLNRSLISGNKAPTGREVYNNTHGTITAANYNIFGAGNNDGVDYAPGANFAPGLSDIKPAVPLGKIIGPLKNNGGPTKTRALPNNSPALDAAPDDAGCPATDQRGVARPQGPLCDIGAYEKQ
jgi:parallel beta-helix repeat protein